MLINEIPMLMAHLFVSDKIPKEAISKLTAELEAAHIKVMLYQADQSPAGKLFQKPRVYVSLGDHWEQFPGLFSLPPHEKRRWLHYGSVDEVSSIRLMFCWLKATDPLPENKIVPPSQFSSDTPLISVFTASYRSGDKIQRPYQSLLKQTYSNWEWVIVDDSNDQEENYNRYLLPLEDERVRRYRQDASNGYIGSVKRYAAGLCTGEILVEVDHDDELMPDCLEKIVRAFQQHPECGFAYGDCSEVYAGSNRAHWYGWDCGYGYSVYYRVWLHDMGRWQNVQKHTTINGNTIRHLVGLPNHPRAWTRDCYHLVGGHRSELLVSDDYDLLVRTFLCTRYLYIPDLLYIQYRNEHGNNTTFTRNKQIQVLVGELNRSYRQRIGLRLTELDLPELLPYNRIWQTSPQDPARKSGNVLLEDGVRVSVIFPLPYTCTDPDYTQLYSTIQRGLDSGFKEMEVIIVGRIPEELEKYASMAPTGAIRWWTMEEQDSLEICIQYAKIIATSREKVVVMP